MVSSIATTLPSLNRILVPFLLLNSSFRPSFQSFFPASRTLPRMFHLHFSPSSPPFFFHFIATILFLQSSLLLLFHPSAFPRFIPSTLRFLPLLSFRRPIFHFFILLPLLPSALSQKSQAHYGLWT